MNLCKNCYYNNGKPDNYGFHMCEKYEHISAVDLKKRDKCEHYQNTKIKLRIKVMTPDNRHTAYYHVQVKRWWGWKTISVEISRHNAEYIYKEIRNCGPEYKI